MTDELAVTCESVATVGPLEVTVRCVRLPHPDDPDSHHGALRGAVVYWGADGKPTEAYVPTTGQAGRTE